MTTIEKLTKMGFTVRDTDHKEDMCDDLSDQCELLYSMNFQVNYKNVTDCNCIDEMEHILSSYENDVGSTFYNVMRAWISDQVDMIFHEKENRYCKEYFDYLKSLGFSDNILSDKDDIYDRQAETYKRMKEEYTKIEKPNNEILSEVNEMIKVSDVSTFEKAYQCEYFKNDFDKITEVMVHDWFDLAANDLYNSHEIATKYSHLIS